MIHPGSTDTGKFARRYRTMIAAFNVYRVGGLIAESVPPPRIYTRVHGLTSEAEAEVVATGEYGVVFRTTARLVTALSHSRMAFVESPLHAMIFRARVLDARPDKGCVALSAFEHVPQVAERRSLARVAPPRPIAVRVSSPELDLRGQVADVSATALAAEFGLRTELELPEDTKGEVRVATSLFGGSPLTLSGHIQRIVPKARQDLTWWRIVVALTRDPRADNILNDYVSERQAQLLAELELPEADAPLPLEPSPERED